MAKLTFTPGEIVVDAVDGQKLLVTARKNKINIRFGCASCKCGTCAVKTDHPEAFHPMQDDEQKLLSRMRLSVAGDVRLACQAKARASVDHAVDASVDISFQDTYSPDDGDGDGSL
jgi:ferredoxin